MGMVISAAMQREAEQDPTGEGISRTELDSHANMAVAGRGAYILAETGKDVEVSAFTPEHEPMKYKVVDVAIQYDDPYDQRTYAFVIRNALHVPAMTNNLIPPFMIREAGIRINDIPKIHVKEPTEDDHAIIFSETGLRVPMLLWGTFSYFPSSKPSVEFLQDTEDIYVITPNVWNPHSDAYAYNEESMLDWQGYMKEPKDRSKRIVLEDIEEDPIMVSSLALSEIEQKAINSRFNIGDDQVIEENKESALYQLMEEQANISDFKMSIGATLVSNMMYLDDDGYETEETIDHPDSD